MAFTILHKWKGSRQRHNRKSRDSEGRCLRDACLGKPRSLHSQWLMKKPTGGTNSSKKDQDGHGTMKYEMFQGFCTNTYRTQTTNWRFLPRWSWSAECALVLSTEFFRYFFCRVSYTCSGNYSVYDGGCTYTHLMHAFFCPQRVHKHSRACSSVYIHAWLKFMRKVFVAWESFLSSRSPFLMIHLSLLFLDGNFETRARLQWQACPHDLAVLSRPKSARHAQFRTCITKFGYLAKSDATKHKFYAQRADDDKMLIMWGGRGRRTCRHPRWSRSSAGFPLSSCWAPAAARRWGGRMGKRNTDGRQAWK